MVRRSLSADARPCPFFRGSGANGSTTGRLDASMEINQRRPHQPNAAAHRSILAGGLFRSLHSLARRLRGKIGLRCVESRENRVGRQAGSLAFRWSDTRFATSCLAGLMAPPPPKVGSGGSRDPLSPDLRLTSPPPLAGSRGRTSPRRPAVSPAQRAPCTSGAEAARRQIVSLSKRTIFIDRVGWR